MNEFFNFFKDFQIIFKKPKIVIVTGEGRVCAKEAIKCTLKPYFKIGQDILILDSELKKEEEIKRLKFLIKNSQLPILVVTHVGDIPFDKDFFAGEIEKTYEIRKLAKALPYFSYLVLNFDDETVREIKDETNLNEITFGFQKGSDFRAEEIRLNKGINFKVSYKGNIVPFWIEGTFGKEQIYSGLCAIAVGTILGLNLVEICQSLKNYSSIPGKMKLIEGIKNSWIIDDTDSATLFSMIEAIEILGKIDWAKRKIAVLGDIIGIGKYTIEAHEAIGERIVKNTDLLFTFGQRAKFISQKAFEKGMNSEKIFHFNTIKEGISKLKDEIKEGDLILVDGSREMKMKEIVDEIKKIL
jgi:UDP-N-acetylmuramoyl-tripeptide--D-alanyl-D-alanine ligase